MTTAMTERTIDEAARAWKKSRATIFKWRNQGRIRTKWREREGRSVLVVLDRHPPKPAARGTLKPEQRQPWGRADGERAEPNARVHKLPFKVTEEMIETASLTAKEKFVAVRRFLKAPPWTLTKIAKHPSFKVSRQAVFEIEKTVRTKLHAAHMRRSK